MMGGLSRVGYLPGTEVFMAKELVDLREDPYRELLARKFPEEDLDKYFHCTPTLSATLKSFKLYCQRPAPPPLTEEQKWAGNQMLEWVYRGVLGTSELWSEAKVVVTMPDETSPGRLWKRAGYKTKLDAYASGRKLIQEFCRTAHLRDTPVVWSVSGKNEMLPLEKLNKERIRTFVVAPVEFYVLQATLCGDMNDRLKRANEKTNLVPCVWFKGHNRLAKRLLKFTHQGAGDATGYDRELLAFLFEIAYEFRKRCYRTRQLDTQSKLDYVRNTIVRSLCLLPDGSLWYKDWGNTSGQFSTTVDNEIIHVFIKGVMVWEKFQTLPPQMPGDFSLYADDHVEAWNGFWSFEERAEGYAKCGVLLKKEADIMQVGLEGITYLGFEFRRRGTLYLPVMNRARILNAVLRPGKKCSSDIQNQRLFGFVLLAVHDWPLREVMWELYLDHCVAHDFVPIVPSPEKLEKWMLGEEGLVDFPPLNRHQLLQTCWCCVGLTGVHT